MTHRNDNNRVDAGGTEPATTRDLIELAVIDALGLLDDEERVAFERGVASAPATLREMIREEQARMADISALLPEVDPDPSLRERTISRIALEIERKHGAGGASAPARRVAHAAGASVDRPVRLQRARRVNPAWRIAAVGMSVAVVALSVVQVQMRRQIDSVSEDASASALIDSAGTGHIEDVLFNETVERYYLRPVGNVGNAKATLLINRDRGSSCLHYGNFANGATYRLVVLDDAGEAVSELCSFKAEKLISNIAFDMPFGDEPMRIAIIVDGETPRRMFEAEVRRA